MINCDSNHDYSLHIVDFGLALDFTKKYKWACNGTPKYMSPKMQFLCIRNKLKPDTGYWKMSVQMNFKMCDIYSLGLSFLRLILKSRILFLIGDGNQKISWIHLNDLSELFYKISKINYA